MDNTAKREKKEIVIDEGRGFKGVWIAKRLYLTREFTPNEKFVLIEIYSLSTGEKKQCYASNKHFADFVGLKENTVQKMLLKFENAGYIKRIYTYKANSKEIDKRIITLTDKFYKAFINEYEPCVDDMENNQHTGGNKSIEGGGIKSTEGMDKKSEESNTNIKYNNTLSDTDLSDTNKYAFSEDKSSSKVSNIYAFSPEEKEVCGTQKQNRFISADYSYKELREHIRPVYESVLKDVYGCTADDTPIEDMLDITEGFYRLYKQEIGIKHRVLSDKAYMNLVDAFMNPPEIMNEDYMFNCEEHMKMARLYFKTDYNKQKKFKGTIERSISHFMTDTVRSNLFYRACYYGEE